MRYILILLIFASFSCFGQSKQDSIICSQIGHSWRYTETLSYIESKPSYWVFNDSEKVLVTPIHGHRSGYCERCSLDTTCHYQDTKQVMWRRGDNFYLDTNTRKFESYGLQIGDFPPDKGEMHFSSGCEPDTSFYLKYLNTQQK